jgi:hypothetical protein
MIDSRISRIPRRNWRDRAAEASGLNGLLRAPGGSQVLHDIQAVALLEAWEAGGVCCYARVGTGKTLILGLLPTLMAAHPTHPCTRPLIVVPGALREKTEADFAAARAHWKIAHQYWLESYTALAQESRADILEERQPDMLLFDEPDGLRRINATSRRIGRYLEARRLAGKRTFCGFFHATPYRDAITDCSHMINWALGEGSPLPLDPVEIAQWSSWLDQEDGIGEVAFTKYFGLPPAHGQPGGPTPDAIEWSEDRFRERVTSCPGLILSDDTFTGSELSVNVYNVDPGLNREFEMLRTLWQKPDGWQLLDATATDDPDEVNTWSIWGVARQLACGFFYVADPTPPKDWMAARKRYADYVRSMIDAPNSKFDTEKQVRTACERAFERGGRKVPEWAEWMAIRDSFTPRSRPVWVGTHALEAAKAWGAQGPGVVWVDHVAFGERLAAETGWAYHGQRGLDCNGRRIEDASPDRPVIASRLANQRGRNLQHSFSRNLIMAMPNAGVDFEQLLGRTHRHGQRAAHVTVDIYCACSEHAKALDVKVPKSSLKAQRLWGLTQKVLSTSLNFHGASPDELAKASWAWR